MVIQEASRRRSSLRAEGFDYSTPGYYFVTICVQNKQHRFGKVVDGQMALSDAGLIVKAIWDSIPARFAQTEIDSFVVMPNHIHGIIGIGVQPGEISEDRPILGNIVRTFKAASTVKIKRETQGMFQWQKNYHDRIIRTERELEGIRKYIEANPGMWHLDRENIESPTWHK